MKNKKRIMLGAACATMLACASVTCLPKHAMPAYAEEDETVLASSEPEHQEEAEEQQDVTQEIENAIKNGQEWLDEKWNRFIAPLIGGVSLGTLVVFIANLALNIKKNRKSDKNYREAIAKLVEAERINSETAKVLNQLQELFVALVEAMDSNQEISLETKDILAEGIAKIQEKVDSQAAYLELSSKVEPILRLLAQLTAKMAESNSDMAKADTLADVKEIQRMLREL